MSTLANFFTGTIGQAFSSSCIIYIMFIMILLSIRMYRKQGKKAYLYLIFGFLLIMTYQGLNIHFSINEILRARAISYFVEILQTLSFIILNLAIYQLYNRNSKRTVIYCCLLVMGILILPIVQLLIDPLFLSGPPTDHFAGVWPLQAYNLVLCLIFALTLGRRIRQQLKYYSSLVLYGVILVLNLLGNHVLTKPSAFIELTHNLLPIVYYTLLYFILFDRVVELLQSVYRSSITDGLTSLYNRRYFNKVASHYIHENLRVSVIFSDIDNFKKLNDTEGHHRADGVLKQVANIMTEELEGIGITGRYGGEELVALVVDKDAKVEEVAETIRRRVASESIVTISVGHSTLRKGVTTEELVKQADQAMYHSKTTGKNKVTAYADLQGSTSKPDRKTRLG
ncbi:GGDEF domain-containing protein [Paenibacillus terrigena]|uniref:GGDEF domain-containing protein n=1 Tax=Paenibacillus terrigena TaxID=369333 RepID=UPI0028D00BFD|nr:GGDEF domain-containing protein [Paenibacillus terrigena]